MSENKSTQDPAGRAAEDPVENELLDKLRETTPGQDGASPGTPTKEPASDKGSSKP